MGQIRYQEPISGKLVEENRFRFLTPFRSKIDFSPSPSRLPKLHPDSLVVNSVFRLTSPGTGRGDVLNRGGRLDGGASGDDARGCVVDGVEPGGELEVVLSLPGGTITVQDTFSVLGYGVRDSAMVATAAYCLVKCS